MRAEAAAGAGALRTVIAIDIDEEQRIAVDAPFDRCVAIVGLPGTGKTFALNARIDRARQEFSQAAPLVFTGERRIDALAFEILDAGGVTVRRIDDVEASLLFEGACEPLFDLAWEEFAAELLDPEVPGLRSPERFVESAFRLIRKLRDARISPADFLARSLSGATEFYAKPPNFASPALMAATKKTYHDSLDVNPNELRRQHRREVDLAKILAKLYESYVELVASTGLMTGRDAVCAAADLLSASPQHVAALSAKHPVAFVDHAEDLTTAELALLGAIYGEALDGVTLCGDPSSAIASVRVAPPETAFARALTRVELTLQRRSPDTIDAACRRIAGSVERSSAPLDAETALVLRRTKTEREEAAFIAERVKAWLDLGTPPHRIAVLLRSVRDAEHYERALLERNIPVATGGDSNVFADRRALDALALLWNVHDPFRHDWMLRTLSSAALGLSDASLAILCKEPPNPQAPLFTLDDEPAPTARSSRWDPKRDLRLGWNVVRGEQDDALDEVARERLVRFRAQRAQWLGFARSASFETFARAVWHDALARDGDADSARARAQQLVLQRLLARLNAFLEEHPDATLGDVLAYAEQRAGSELESCEAVESDEFVSLLSIEAGRGREFDYVAIAGAGAGTFPRWYAPDAFLFSPRIGMVPKENVGECRASRTAKFSYYVARSKAREGYNDRERRAFVYALRRARLGAVVTASGGVTRGTTAPEFLEELRAARLPGVETA
ncbi:MAG TPA: ATP-dependent helicase [Candidatus Baltobacteraceae bacterium]|nr:ATP-dependent helicase [Candidatus Baltobacteraceae bacterium]